MEEGKKFQGCQGQALGRGGLKRTRMHKVHYYKGGRSKGMVGARGDRGANILMAR